jgi:hypothetical protein
MAELKRTMENNTTVLSQMVQRTAIFRAKQMSQAPASIFDLSFATHPVGNGDGSSIFSSTFFTFDDEIVNSLAYRRVMAKAHARSNHEESSQSASEAPESSDSAKTPHSDVSQTQTGQLNKDRE